MKAVSIKVLIVSLNGVQELSGGGLYLRSVVRAFASLDHVEVTVISKEVGEQSVSLPEKTRYVYVPKTVRSDIVSRAMLNPTFLGTSTGLIAQHAQEADLVVLHNSRCGRILSTLKRQFPGKRFGIISDNSEYDLRRLHEASNWLRKLERAIDSAEIYAAEKRCLQADFISFITRKDRDVYIARYGQPAVNEILPITVEAGISATELRPAQHPRVIFTGHFGFAPNVSALQTFAQAAEQFRLSAAGHGVSFAAAGAGLSKCSIPGEYFERLESPSSAQMQAFFRSASVYLAPVAWGSGMKTKVAEALSYGLPVICMANAAEGYEDVLSSDHYRCVIEVVNYIGQMVKGLAALFADPDELLRRRQLALEAFHLYLSPDSQARRMQSLLAAIGLEAAGHQS